MADSNANGFKIRSPALFDYVTVRTIVSDPSDAEVSIDTPVRIALKTAIARKGGDPMRMAVAITQHLGQDETGSPETQYIAFASAPRIWGDRFLSFFPFQSGDLRTKED